MSHQTKRTREDLLEATRSAHALAQSYLARNDEFPHGQVTPVTKMLDAIEARLGVVSWPPPPGTFDGVVIGLYAARNLEEIARDLADALHSLDYALKGL